jgi:2-amino-4-hydroxy-6-hydroxymethyldihydropteridine diphosphokinase
MKTKAALGPNGNGERVFVALGTNLGDRLLNLAEACRRIARLPSVTLRARSPLIQTPALLAPDDTFGQPDFLNCVVELRTSLEPLALLACLLNVERGMGRLRTTRWAPRVIDLDLVLYGRRTLETSTLTLPHPGLTTRRFVLQPLAALAPDLTHPLTGATVRELLDGVLRTTP